MLASLLPSTAVGQALLLAALAIAALVLVEFWRRRAAAYNCRLSTALDNMSQGLCMFDAQGAHRSAQSPLHRDVQIVAADRAAGLLAARSDPASQGHRIVFAATSTPIAGKSWMKRKKATARSSTCNQATAATCWPGTSRCRTAAGCPPMRTSPNNAAPSRNAARATTRTSGARPPTRRSPRSARRWRCFLSSVQRQRDRHALDRERAARLFRSNLAARGKRRAGV